MTKFTAIVPCYDSVRKHSIGTKISYHLFYGIQYPTMNEKIVYNLSTDKDSKIATDFWKIDFKTYTPLFGPVVNALLASNSISEVILLGDKNVLKKTFEYSGIIPDVTILHRKESLGLNLFSTNKHLDLEKHVLICMPDVPLITTNDVDRLINIYLENSDLTYHDFVAGFVPKTKYEEVSDIKKEFLSLKSCGQFGFNTEYFKESCAFLVKLSKFTPQLVDRVYANRKLLMIPQQIFSLMSDPGRITKLKIFAEYILGKTHTDSLSAHISEYFGGKVKLVLHDIVNFSIDGDSLEDIIKLSQSFR